MNFINRTLNLATLLKKRNSFFLFGARGTGKTQALSLVDCAQFDLLDTKLYRRYLNDPGLFYAEVEALIAKPKMKSPVIIAIDEIQKIPSLLDEVHRLIEKYHEQRLIFILTGSSARKLKRGGANLLAGRAHTYELFPLSHLEIEINLNRALSIGTLPKVYLNPDSAIDTLEAYVTTYLREEILEESLVRKIERFSRFLELAAQLNAEPINFVKLGKQLGTSGQTTQEYFSILVDTLLAYRIDGWSHSVKKQLLQAPKFYMFDCGVINTLTGELRSELKSSSFRFGRLFETWLICELIRTNSYSRLGLRFHYWRDKDGHEVDVIVSRSAARPLVAIEIKSSEAPALEDVKGFQFLEYPELPHWCLCQTPRAFKKGGVEFLPWKEGLTRLAGLK